MRKHIFLLILLCSLLPAAAVPDSPRSFVDRGRGLFESGRWADARHEFLAARRLLSPEQLSEAEEIDFFLAACAVELGSEEAESALLRFIAEHPRSVYNNDVRFALASCYCARDDMRRAREMFD